MKNQNKLLLAIITMSTLSQINCSDGFFKSVGNVATLGEANRAKERRKNRDTSKSSTNKKKSNNSTSKKRSNKKESNEDNE